MEIIRHIALRDIHVLTFQLKVFTSYQENYTSQCIKINIFGIHSTKRIASYINGNYTTHCIEGYSYINIPTKSFYFPSRKSYITVHRNKYVVYIPLKGWRRTSMEIILHIALRDIHILTLQLKVFTSHQENHTSQCIEINMWFTFH